MATVKPLLDSRYKSKDGTHQIIVRIRNGKDLRDMGTGYRVKPDQWNGEQVKNNHRDARLINSHIDNMVSEAKQYIAECNLHRKPIRLDLIGKARMSYNWNEYLLRRADQYAAKEMIVMESKMRRFDREFRVFNTRDLTFTDLLDDERMKRPLRGNTLYMDDINPDLLRRYEAFLVKQGNVNNTRAKKFEFLGKFYEDAINDGKAEAPNHFKLYKITSKPVKKEKLTEDQVKAIEELQLKPGPVNDARNLWLFSYYCKGNRFETCITCSRDMIRDGRIYLKTNKGEKHISVKIHARLQGILDQYVGDSPLLFPYIKELPSGAREYLKTIDSLNVIVNRNLKIIAQLAGITIPLTFHIARHTFAIHLKKKTDSMHVIQDSLGHSKSSTTEIYLKALDDEILDKEMDKLYGE